MVEIADLVKRYPGAPEPALRGVTLTVPRGEFLAVIGLSGSGKSTLLRCINRLIDPTSGRIKVNFKAGPIQAEKARGAELRRLRGKIGMIFQHFNLVKRISVLANVLTGTLGRTGVAASLIGKYSEEDRVRALQNLERVGILDQAYKRADQLSGGQQQRVAIARALMQDPEILLADEPVSSLDPAISISVLDHLRQLNQELGITILCNLHFLELVRDYASQAVALKDGRIVFAGDPQEITDERFVQIYGEQAREVSIR